MDENIEKRLLVAGIDPVTIQSVYKVAFLDKVAIYVGVFIPLLLFVVAAFNVFWGFGDIWLFIFSFASAAIICFAFIMVMKSNNNVAPIVIKTSDSSLIFLKLFGFVVLPINMLKEIKTKNTYLGMGSIICFKTADKKCYTYASGEGFSGLINEIKDTNKEIVIDIY